MPRIYSSYTDEEILFVKEMSQKLGMTVSAYQKYCVLLYQGRQTEQQESIDLQALIAQMSLELNAKKSGDTFIVSSLLRPEQWAALNRGQKITLSLCLKSLIEKQPEKFEVCGVFHNNIKEYMRK